MGGDITLPLIYLTRHDISRRKPHTTLITVILKQQNTTDYLQKDEEQPVMIHFQEIQQVAHSQIIFLLIASGS